MSISQEKTIYERNKKKYIRQFNAVTQFKITEVEFYESDSKFKLIENNVEDYFDFYNELNEQKIKTTKGVMHSVVEQGKKTNLKIQVLKHQKSMII